MTPKKIAYFSIGPLGSALLGLIAVPIITWFFSQEDVGRMGMLQVTISFSVMLFSLGLDQSYVREFHEATNKPALLKLSFFPGMIMLLLSLAMILLFGGGSLSGWLFGIRVQHLSQLVALALVVSFFSRFLSLVLRMNERGFAYSVSQVAPKLLLLIIVGVYVLIDVDNNLTNLIAANVAGFVLAFFVQAWCARNELILGLRSTVNIRRLKSMLRFGAPLILGGVAFWGLTAVDKIFLRAFSSFNELGLYSVSVSFAAIGMILQSVFSTIWAPTVYKWASRGQGLENVYRVTRYVLILVIIGFCLAGLLSWMLEFLLPPGYAEVQWIVISCLGYPLLYTLSETTVVGIGISKRSGYSMLAAILALVVDLCGNWLLIPVYGAAGAAVSTCASFWIFLFFRTEFSIYVWKVIPRKLVYIYSFLVVSGAIVFTLWGRYLGSVMEVFWVMMLCSIFFVFRDELKEVRGLVLLRTKRNA